MNRIRASRILALALGLIPSLTPGAMAQDLFLKNGNFVDPAAREVGAAIC